MVPFNKVVEIEDFDDRKVADCELFVIILGHLHGTCPDGSEKSYTELEYEAAVKYQKTCFLFLAPEDFPFPASLIESDEKRAKQRISDFEPSAFLCTFFIECQWAGVPVIISGVAIRDTLQSANADRIMTNQQFWSWVQLGQLIQADVVPKGRLAVAFASRELCAGAEMRRRRIFGVKNGDRSLAHERSFRVPS